METRRLGNLEVSALGLGCMGMSERLEETFPRGVTAGDRYANMSTVNR